MPKSV